MLLFYSYSVFFPVTLNMINLIYFHFIIIAVVIFIVVLFATLAFYLHFIHHRRRYLPFLYNCGGGGVSAPLFLFSHFAIVAATFTK